MEITVINQRKIKDKFYGGWIMDYVIVGFTKKDQRHVNNKRRARDSQLNRQNFIHNVLNNNNIIQIP